MKGTNSKVHGNVDCHHYGHFGHCKSHCSNRSKEDSEDNEEEVAGVSNF